MKKILILIILAFLTINYISKKEYVEIPSTSIRMRVIAASNSKKDQKDKMIIKDIITKKLSDKLKDAKTYEEADDILKNSITELTNTIEKTLKDYSIEDNFSINYGLNYFPEKTYNGVTYNSGNYQSLVVTLNEGKGENWWCALYPPICQIDDNGNNEYRFLIKDLLSQYN